jgi:hypothetical protein
LQDDNSTANKLNLTTDELAELGIKEKDLEQIIKELSSLDENGDPKGVINVPDETDINSSGSEEAMSPTQV